MCEKLPAYWRGLLSVAIRGTVTLEMPLAIVPTSKTCVCFPHSKG
jgi:hypothetical protein